MTPTICWRSFEILLLELLGHFLICKSKIRPKLNEYGTSMRFWLINVFFNCWLGNNRQTVSWLGIEFPSNVAGKSYFSYHPAGSAEQIFFSQQHKKNVKEALKAFTFHFYMLFATFCENVLLGAPAAFEAISIRGTYFVYRETIVTLLAPRWLDDAISCASRHTKSVRRLLIASKAAFLENVLVVIITAWIWNGSIFNWRPREEASTFQFIRVFDLEAWRF